jgi:hypothetical protein
VFHFVVTDDTEHRRELHSFAIDSEIATDALYDAHPSRAPFRVPAPANEIEPTNLDREDSGIICRGSEQFLTIEMVALEDPPPKAVTTLGPPGAGIRFALSDGARHPLYSFTMNWPLAFVMLGVAWEKANGC